MKFKNELDRAMEVERTSTKMMSKSIENIHKSKGPGALRLELGTATMAAVTFNIDREAANLAHRTRNKNSNIFTGQTLPQQAAIQGQLSHHDVGGSGELSPKNLPGKRT